MKRKTPLSEKEDPSTWLDGLSEHPGKEAVSADLCWYQ